MKRPIASLLAGILLATSLPALADRPHHRHGWHKPHHAPAVRHHHHRDGLALGLAGLALGGIILSTMPPPVVVTPPVVVAPPPPRPPERYWYYCESYRAYYPTVGYCPEGWRAIPGY
jgi:hypothetical protein